ncbi:hypothetical protein CW362_37205 [Streptomyces populi]|uniref:Calcium-binding protein n=1 Tax=Streptomyces populi TaxID=2058924 RepID=A0A2I0SDP1_9ACTN|nr:hypothetical protein [Streptomyces populi]PKT68030.1 hypothetical protein CW362_37205 [Streptomyces populi]
MRKYAIGAVVSGALALSALAVPSASAATPDLSFSGVVVNNGKAIVVGTTNLVKVPVTYTFVRPAGLVIDGEKNGAGVLLYRGPSLARQENELEPDDAPVCTTKATTATTVTQSCKEVIEVDPQEYLYEAADAGTWKVAGFYGDTTVDDDDSDNHISMRFGYDMWGVPGTAQVKRAARLTADATPEPVKKGATLTVKGALTRADWKNGKYTGYKGQSVVLQFKAKGATAYKAVKTVTSGTAGALSTTVKASADGTYRYAFAGTATTGTATAAGDYVDVK